MTATEREELEKTRDMFAGMAMQELTATLYNDVTQSYDKLRELYSHVPAISYDCADAMIEEKLKRLKKRRKLDHPANVNELEEDY